MTKPLTMKRIFLFYGEFGINDFLVIPGSVTSWNNQKVNIYDEIE
jgi:hypothetical protein